ncbi:hypothetical protein STAFG_8798 [Streptomyces afghaniensis 772]|uniref:Uncharacterized protein n=1 Tax=Streptomyces afghaniensis 772 TaxID=1283301 RepID=S4MKY6_9ACTN|nr:hypothetical protein STAFG_8798 [Streptomyces afghaniensis 772]
MEGWVTALGSGAAPGYDGVCGAGCPAPPGV